FFFQAEDGIRDATVTGVQTCALPIWNGRDDTEPHRQRYECKGCRQRFDDLTDTIFAGHHQPLRTWIACLYLMGLNLSGLQIAQRSEERRVGKGGGAGWEWGEDE